MGTLTGIRIVEFAGLGPGPFAGMLLSDMGADITRIDRPCPVRTTLAQPREHEAMLRNRRSISLDLREPDSLDVALRLIDRADVLIEGYRPGVAERLGIGPEVCLKRNPGLVYGRMTGWGQDGPQVGSAGHDINYIALTGALHAVGATDGPPLPPLVLAGDTGGGGAFLALGICAALVERTNSGRGQVVDSAIVDGAAALMSPMYGALPSGSWTDRRGANSIDGGAPFYRTYRCADDRYVAVGAIEEPFFAALLEGLELDPARFADRMNRDRWPDHARLLAEVFATRTRDEWATVFDDTDACVTPVLDLTEAPNHRRNLDRGTFTTLGSIPVPGVAPRFGRTPSAFTRLPVEPGTDTAEVLAELNVAQEEDSNVQRPS